MMSQPSGIFFIVPSIMQRESLADVMFFAQQHRVMSTKRDSVMVRFIDLGLNVVIFTDAKVMKNCVKDERKWIINVNLMKLKTPIRSSPMLGLGTKISDDDQKI